jgi:hypothetical protein
VVCGAHLLVLSNDEQAGLGPVVVVAAVEVRDSSKFSQCTMVWGDFSWARGLGCGRFDSGWCFISA